MKWEYLPLSIISSSDGSFAVIQDEHDNNISFKINETITSIINKLGDKCWELVNFEQGYYMFKRPIES